MGYFCVEAALHAALPANGIPYPGPDIGSMMKNPLRVCPTGGMLWLSIYKAAEETTLR